MVNQMGSSSHGHTVLLFYLEAFDISSLFNFVFIQKYRHAGLCLLLHHETNVNDCCVQWCAMGFDKKFARETHFGNLNVISDITFRIKLINPLCTNFYNLNFPFLKAGNHCWLCGKNCNSDKQWQQHITSDKHKDKMFNSEDEQNCWQYRFPTGTFRVCERWDGGHPLHLEFKFFYIWFTDG